MHFGTSHSDKLGKVLKMAIVADQIYRVTISGAVGVVPVLQVSHWRIVSVGSEGINATNLAEALWNHGKDALRGLVNTSYSTMFQAVRAEQVDNPLGEFGEYAIPLDERGGRRGAAAGAGVLPANVPARLRLLVGTKQTKGGAKRLTGLVEDDIQNGGYLLPAVLTALEAVGDFYVGEKLLGAPAALTYVVPGVYRPADHGPGTPQRFNPFTGYVAGTRVTTQNTRKRLN